MTRAIAACVLTAGALISGCAQARTPADTYLEYHGAVLKAKSVEDLATFMPKADRDKLATAPAAAKEFTFGLRQDMEKMVVGAPRVVKEDVQGTAAVVGIEATIDYTAINPNFGQKPAQATVKLVKEADGWKVVNAPNWQMK